MAVSAMRQLARIFATAAILLLVPLHAAAAPSVTINQAAVQPDPTNASPVLFTVVFSESVTGFTAAGRVIHRQHGRRGACGCRERLRGELHRVRDRDER
jgi:hypothetical protein